MKAVRELNDENFNSYFDSFFGMISIDGNSCLVNQGVSVAVDGCDNTDEEQRFLFFHLSNGKFVIRDSGGSCLDFESGFGECDYDSEAHWMNVGEDLAENRIRDKIVDIYGEDFFTDIIISVVSGVENSELGLRCK